MSAEFEELMKARDNSSEDAQSKTALYCLKKETNHCVLELLLVMKYYTQLKPCDMSLALSRG